MKRPEDLAYASPEQARVMLGSKRSRTSPKTLSVLMHIICALLIGLAILSVSL